MGAIWPGMDDSLSLHRRARLPDALRVLLDEMPRAGWEANPNYSQLIAFWLDRHLMFRKVTERLTEETRAALDGGDPQHYRRALSHLGGHLINGLHGHHQIEDAHYFPVMAALDTPVRRGFDILDADHHALDPLLHGLAEDANAVLRPGEDGLTDRIATFHKRLGAFDPFLNRHLEDEEELVVPVLLKYAPEEFR